MSDRKPKFDPEAKWIKIDGSELAALKTELKLLRDRWTDLPDGEKHAYKAIWHFRKAAELLVDERDKLAQAILDSRELQIDVSCEMCWDLKMPLSQYPELTHTKECLVWLSQRRIKNE